MENNIPRSVGQLAEQHYRTLVDNPEIDANGAVRGKAVFIKGKETARGIAVSSILRVPFTGKLDFSKAKA